MQGSNGRAPFRGIIPTALLLIAVPVVFIIIIKDTLALIYPGLTYVNDPSARFVGSTMGALFHLSCLISGALRPAIQSFKFRFSEFFQNLRCSVGFAFSCYWDDIRQDGMAFDLYLVIMLVNAGYGLYNLQVALKLLHII